MFPWLFKSPAAFCDSQPASLSAPQVFHPPVRFTTSIQPAYRGCVQADVTTSSCFGEIQAKTEKKKNRRGGEQGGEKTELS